MNILCLSSYPADEPRHGGQHRLHNIIEAFRSKGHEVCSAGVLGSSAYPPSPHYVRYPGNDVISRMLKNHSLMEDWAISALFGEDNDYSRSLMAKIPMTPDAIYVEQPWLFSFAEVFNAMRCDGRAPIYYGSANIEHRLKRDILGRVHDEPHLSDAVNKVLICETHAMMRAARTFCVSKDDAAWMQDYTTKQPILAPNSVVDRVPYLADVVEANQISQSRKFALYCASGHPPNIEGFFDMFANGVGCIPPEARLIVAGSAGGTIAQDPRFSRLGSLHRQFINAKEVPESTLRGLLATAHMIILPITMGGGTNLKSAEAIWAGKHIVATTKAMRGFERFIRGQGISVADDSASFCNAILHAFAKPNLTLSAQERVAREVVLWKHSLKDLVATVTNLERSL